MWTRSRRLVAGLRPVSLLMESRAHQLPGIEDNEFDIAIAVLALYSNGGFIMDRIFGCCSLMRCLILSVVGSIDHGLGPTFTNEAMCDGQMAASI
jgi:hypothetical protein